MNEDGDSLRNKYLTVVRSLPAPGICCSLALYLLLSLPLSVSIRQWWQGRLQSISRCPRHSDDGHGKDHHCFGRRTRLWSGPFNALIQLRRDDFLNPVLWKKMLTHLVECRVENSRPDALAAKMIDTELPPCLPKQFGLCSSELDKQDASMATKIDADPPPCFWKEDRRMVKTLQRANTVTLGDYLDPTYLDPSLWKHLPLHLLELILSKVPFRDLVTMRRVCKHWNALILSEGFSPPFVPALIMFARTPTVRKMMWERNQPISEGKNCRKWSIFRLWRRARRMFNRKPEVRYY